MKRVLAFLADVESQQSSRCFRAKHLTVTMAMAVMSVMLASCEGCQGTVETVYELGCPPGSTPGCGVAHQLGKPETYVVKGRGRCETLRIDWSDGSPPEDFTNVDLTSLPEYTHTFTGWEGGKTFTAEGIKGCVGKVSKRFTIGPNIFPLAWAHTRNQNRLCNAFGPAPLPDRAWVRVTIPANAGTVDFGCVAGGCVYGPDGKPGSSAVAPFPFPGMREFSFVMRVGTQPPVQGGNNTQFTTNQPGPLEVCVNDTNLADNFGQWEIHFNIDFLGRS